jgi:4-amino-4-deoxy-L-arabinose transferase-like glycosyltransferase
MTEAPAAPAKQLGPAARGAPWRAAVFVGAYAATVFLPFLGARTLTAHEVMVTHPALRMLDDGHWIVPRYASGFWLDKPPLALSAIGLCVLMTVLAGRFFSARIALLTGLVQATCVYMYMQGRLGEIDIIFAFLLAGAHGVLLWHWGRGGLVLPWRAGVLFHVLAALAVLAKGPVAVALLGSTVIAYSIWRRAWAPIRATLFTPGILVFLLITGAWHVAAVFTAGDEALREWNYNAIMRFLGLHRLGAQSCLVYFLGITRVLLPWTVALLIGARQLGAAYRGPDGALHRFLWSWFLGGLAFLTISLFKHQHYAIPILPPLSILAAIVLDAHILKEGVRARRFYAIVFAVCLVSFGVVGGYVMPKRDHRRATAEFVTSATARVPADETLYVIGLAQSSAYPYIVHKPCDYLDRLEDIQDVLRKRARPMWVFSLRAHLKLAAEHGLQFQEVAGEQPRPKLDWEETAILGLLSESSPPASMPSATQPGGGG